MKAPLVFQRELPVSHVEELRQLGHDVLTVQETGQANRALSDEAVLTFAYVEERILLTSNRRHFIRLHHEGHDHLRGVCRTELDEVEGRIPPPLLPVVLGHQVVGRVAARGPGVAWLYSTCRTCKLCLEIQGFVLEEANTALVELKTRKIRGAKVLRVN